MATLVDGLLGAEDHRRLDVLYDRIRCDAQTLIGYTSESGMLIERQTISTLPKDFEGTSYCADVKITPGGFHLEVPL